MHVYYRSIVLSKKQNRCFLSSITLSQVWQRSPHSLIRRPPAAEPDTTDAMIRTEWVPRYYNVTFVLITIFVLCLDFPVCVLCLGPALWHAAKVTLILPRETVCIYTSCQLYFIYNKFFLIDGIIDSSVRCYVYCHTNVYIMYAPKMCSRLSTHVVI